MAIQPDFSRYYKALSNSELLEILDNPGLYQPEAIDAAKIEVSNRQLSENQIDEAKHTLLEKELITMQNDQKRNEFNLELEKKGNTFIAAINPNQKGISKNEKSIRTVVIALGFIFIYEVVRFFQIGPFFIKAFTFTPFESIVYLLPFAILPVTLFLFWKIKSTGWNLLAIFLTFYIVEATGTIMSTFILYPTGSDYLFQRPNITGVIMQLIIFSGALYTISLERIRKDFSIDKNQMKSIIAFTALLTILIFWVIL